MRRELEQKLVERWPSWFNVTGNQRETRIADGLAHGKVKIRNSSEMRAT